MDIWQFFLLEKSHLVSMKNRIHLVISWPFNNKLKCLRLREPFHTGGYMYMLLIGRYRSKKI